MKKINLTCVIDDDPIFVYGIRRIIQHGQYSDNILIFQNGKVAYDNLKSIVENNEHLPELILLDVNMPIWDGWHFLDEFVKIPIKQKIVILVVSSSDHPEDMAKAKSYDQVANFVVKPVEADQLDEIMNRYF